jgi:hypothetical protein
MVIDHDHIGFGGAAAGPEQKAPLEMLAAKPAAEIGLGRDLVPYFG